MRCPKCHYLSFEPEPRCRNCGFDLSGDPADLSLKLDEPRGPMADLALRPDSEVAARVPAAAIPVEPSAELPARETLSPSRQASISSFRRPGNGANAPAAESPVSVPPVTAPEPEATRPAAPARSVPPPAGTSELPLFVKGMSVVAPPVVAVPEAPPARVPLAVQRRAQPPAPRPQAKPNAPPRKPGPFDGDLLEDLQRIERIERGHAAQIPISRERPVERRPVPIDSAEPWRGLLAAAIDASFISLLNVAILWITLRWSDLAFVDASLLPVLPLGTFFVLVALGYLLMFTAAGGQTLGKMIAGVRVVAANDLDSGWHSISVQQAALRSVLAVSSVLMLGLGFLPALLGSGKSLHDRLAHTRIVRA